MLIVLGTIVVEPDRRERVVADMTARLAEITPWRNGAIEFRLMLSTSEAGTIHVFQTWPDEARFDEWGRDEGHIRFQQEFAARAKSVSSVRYVGEPLSPPL